MTTGGYQGIYGTPTIQMVLPICPICQKQYSLQTKPLTLVPCGHGVCEECQAECVHREILDCSLCRKLVASWVPNYDLRAMLQPVQCEWKENLMSAMDFLAGQDIEIDDSLEVVAPLLMLKARNIQSTDTFKQVLSKLVNVVEPVDLFEWVSVLQFNNEKQLIPAIGKMLDDKQFLESRKALWVLQLVHT